MSTGRLKILVADDEAAMREVLEMRLAEWGFDVVLAADGEQARLVAGTDHPDLVISDIVMPGLTGLQLLAALKEGDPGRPVILVTAYGTIDEAVEAMKRGARDFLTKPLDYAKLRAILADAALEVEARRAARELTTTLDQGAGCGQLVGASTAMREVFDLIESVAASDASVLVSGESGTGKELVARAIHERSARHNGPFVAINVAAIPEGLNESELFGHEKGAFTGAIASRPGCFEMADTGTLFLDEITEMPAALQPKFLRVLEEGRLRRVGGTRLVDFDVRLVAATNRDPEQAVEQGHLRRDLYYRLNVFPVVLPPLRARQGDLPLLAQHFIRIFNAKHRAKVDGLGTAAQDQVARYAWPGNVRELRNVIERAVILAKTGLIAPAHLPAYLHTQGPSAEGGIVVPVSATAAEVERVLILETLKRVGNNKAEAARQLGLDVKTVRNKLKSYGMGSHEE
jgi:DNA-binding NtrC family response regulator